MAEDFTAHDLETMAKLWDEGLSAGEIGQRLGRSRNSIIGKIHRMREAGHVFMRPKQTKEQIVNAAAARRALKRKRTPEQVNEDLAMQARIRYIVAGNGMLIEASPGNPSPLPPTRAQAFEPLPGSEPVTLINLAPYRCKWPVDVAGAEQIHFCNCKAPSGLYCEVHVQAEAQRSRSQNPNAVRNKSGLIRIAERLAA